MNTNQFVCRSCGYVGSQKKVVRGSFLIEVILWCCFIVPGLIYTIWRLTTKQRVCPKCGNPMMIPSDTPVGEKIIGEHKSQGGGISETAAMKKSVASSVLLEKIRGHKIISAVIALFVIGAVVPFFFSSNKDSAPAVPTPPPAAASAQTTPQAAPAPAAQPAAAPKPKPATRYVKYQTLLDQAGSGTASTETFTVANDADSWDLEWSYDCYDPNIDGRTGNFIVQIMNGDGTLSSNIPVNQIGSTDAGTEHYHVAGTYYLEVNSECKWNITVDEVIPDNSGS